MKRSLSLTVTAAVVAATAGAAVAGASAATAAPVTADPGRYVAIAPTRAVDTRVTGGPVLQGGVLPVNLAGILQSQTATAVVINLTATDPTAPGFLTAYPAGTDRPTASSLNKRAGETRSNSVTVALPDDGTDTIDIYNQLGSTQVVVDVVGYYDPAQTEGADDPTRSDFYYSATPYRIGDTRGGQPLSSSGRINAAVEQPDGLTDVTAVALNITAINPSGNGYLTAWDGQGALPKASTVNYGADRVTPNFAVVPVTTVAQDGKTYLEFSIANRIAVVDAAVDVFGYYAAPGGNGSTYAPVSPTRIADTRQDEAGPLGAGETREFAVPDEGADLVTGVNLNATAVDGTNGTYLTVYPAGSDTRPAVSNLNPFTPDARANAVQTEVTPDLGGGTTNYLYDTYNLAGTVNFVADLQGYFLLDGLGSGRTAPQGVPVPQHSSTQR